VVKQAFWNGFEKRADVSLMLPVISHGHRYPLKTDESKKRYIGDRATEGTLAGGGLGALFGGLGGASVGEMSGNKILSRKALKTVVEKGHLKRLGKGALIGGLLGTGVGALAGRHVGKKRGESHASIGEGVTSGHWTPTDAKADAYKKYMKYHNAEGK